MEDNFGDLLETVNFIKEHMATKDDLADVETRLEAKIDRICTKLTKFEENEIDKRLQLEVRVARIEKHLDLPARSRS
jgi:hypothetical protein